MKKTLIALAVLAASGASFAQATISGNYTAGYRSSTGVGATATANGADQSGLGNDTSLVTFTAKEDLGGGLTAGAEMKIDGLTRGGVSGGDSGLWIAGGFGKLAIENGRGSDYLSGGTAGVGGVGFDGKVFSALTASDSITYTTPSFSGFTASISHDESAVDQGTGFENVAPIGLGVGAAGAQPASNYQRGTGVTLAYAAGPLAVNGNYKVWDQQGAGPNTNSKSRVSIRGAYDFGGFKLGAGYRNTQFVTGVRQDTFLAAGTSFGALALGADWGQRVHSDTAPAGGTAVDGTRTGYGLKAEYSLSKRTSLIANYASWERVVGAAQRTTETNLLVSHSF